MLADGIVARCAQGEPKDHPNAKLKVRQLGQSADSVFCSTSVLFLVRLVRDYSNYAPAIVGSAGTAKSSMA